MFRTLYAKLSAGLFVLLTAMGLFYVFVSTSLTRRHFQSLNQQLNRTLARNIVADRNLVEEGRLNADALKATFQLYMSVNPSIEIYLLDLEGKIISYSADPKKIKRQRVDLAPIRSFLAMDAPYPLLGDDPRSHDKKKAFSVTPVPSKENPEGYLYVVLRGEQYDFADQMMRKNTFLRLSLWAVGAALLLGLFGGLIVFHLLTRRLTGLSRTMQSFERSGFADDLDLAPSRKEGKPSDEIDQLERSFASMARRIREQIEQLQERDAMRRELVAQAAHDLRTPLAAMLGYIESVLLKGESLPAEERSKFLSTALRQGQRLSGLVAELFELASLDAREHKPELVAFSLAELIHDVVQKYQLKARENKITITTDIPPDLSLAVGDIALSERVLDNILDNACAHTPGGGTISLTGQDNAGKVVVTICDSGPGIPCQDLPHLFEPFYRGKSSSFDAAHAGLGLAIAKRIMELQNGEIVATNSRCNDPGPDRQVRLNHATNGPDRETDGQKTATADRNGRGACFIITLPARHRHLSHPAQTR